jgi:hypothetical protein
MHPEECFIISNLKIGLPPCLTKIHQTFIFLAKETPVYGGIILNDLRSPGESSVQGEVI